MTGFASMTGAASTAVFSSATFFVSAATFSDFVSCTGSLAADCSASTGAVDWNASPVMSCSCHGASKTPAAAATSMNDCAIFLSKRLFR